MTVNIDPRTRMGAVSLNVSNLDRSVKFYTTLIGLTLRERRENRAWLGAGGEDLLLLTEISGARRVRPATGLYHFALLTPGRHELARALVRVAQSGYPFQGASDHLVSEALYLGDPDGHGIELYRDRPRTEWPRLGDGTLRMDTVALDLDALVAELAGPEDVTPQMHPDTTMGHVHLHVSDIPAAEAFYVEALGFERIMRYGPSASFVAAGGYHHHLGMNTWGTQHAPPPPADSLAMRYYEVLLPDEAACKATLAQVEAAGLPVEEIEGLPALRDPAGNRVALRVG